MATPCCPLCRGDLGAGLTPQQSRSRTPAELALLQSDASEEPGGAATPVEGDDPPKRKEKGADAKKAAALAFFSTVGPPELLKDIG